MLSNCPCCFVKLSSLHFTFLIKLHFLKSPDFLKLLAFYMWGKCIFYLISPNLKDWGGAIPKFDLLFLSDYQKLHSWWVQWTSRRQGITSCSVVEENTSFPKMVIQIFTLLWTNCYLCVYGWRTQENRIKQVT